jgi:hypothetical protein
MTRSRWPHASTIGQLISTSTNISFVNYKQTAFTNAAQGCMA